MIGVTLATYRSLQYIVGLGHTRLRTFIAGVHTGALTLRANKLKKRSIMDDGLALILSNSFGNNSLQFSTLSSSKSSSQGVNLSDFLKSN